MSTSPTTPVTGEALTKLAALGRNSDWVNLWRIRDGEWQSFVGRIADDGAVEYTHGGRSLQADGQMFQTQLIDGVLPPAARDFAQAHFEAAILSALCATPEAPGTGLGSGETEWIGDFLNRRTDVEKVLRDVKRGKRQALSPEECWELANRLSVPANHGGA